MHYCADAEESYEGVARGLGGCVRVQVEVGFASWLEQRIVDRCHIWGWTGALFARYAVLESEVTKETGIAGVILKAQSRV